MRKKQKKQLAIGIILIVALLIFLSSIGIIDWKPFVVSDMSVLSITETKINGEDAIKIYTTANAGGELLDIDFGKNYLNNYLKEYDLEATESITGSIEVGEQSIEFPYSSTGEIIWKKVRVEDVGLQWSCEKEDCNPQRGEEVLFAKGDAINLVNCKCLIGSEKADVGKWESIEKTNYLVTFKIDGLGSTILDRDSQSGYLNEVNLGTYAKIQFTGFLDSYDRVGKPPYDPYLYNNFIYLIEPTAYTLIQDEYGDLKDSYTAYTRNWDVERYNSRLKNLFIDKFSQYDDLSYIKYATRTSSGIKTVLNYPTKYPSFEIILNAKEVGIIEQVGQPDNLFCESFKFLSNELGQSKCYVKNSGKEGCFRVDVGSCSGVSAFVVGGNNLGCFNEGESKDFTITIQGSTDNENGENVGCDVKVYDFNDPSKYDIYNVKGFMEYNPGGKCRPIGDLKCDEEMKNLMECKSTGDYMLKEECKFGCTYGDDGKALCRIEQCKIGGMECIGDEECCSKFCKDGKCVDVECPPITLIQSTPPIIKNDVTIPDFICLIKVFFRKLFSGAFSILGLFKWLAVILVGIFSFLFGKDIFDNFKVVRKNQWIGWTLSGFVALLFGYLVYRIFFVGLVIFIIFIIFKSIVGRTPFGEILKRR